MSRNIHSTTPRLRWPALASWTRLGVGLSVGLSVAAGFAFSGCSFGTKTKLSQQQNTCTMNSDCDTHHCKDGLCVMETDESLGISLEVTPQRMPDGSQAVPLVFGTFGLDGPPHRSFELVLPVAVTGKVHQAKLGITANVLFTQTDSTDPRGPRSVQVSTIDPAAPGDGAFRVPLLPNAHYHVLVEPTDTSLPPYALDFVAKAKSTVDVDYSSFKWSTHNFVVQNAPSNRKLVMRALDKSTGLPISNSAPITNGLAQLQFASELTAYRLEITPQESYVSGTSNSACDNTTPVFPTLSADDSVLSKDKAGDSVLVLPQIPMPIHYSGKVTLCPGASTKGLNDMPMALDASALRFTSNKVAIDASYNATSMATLDPNGRELTFCTRVLPGDYVVVITPPANVQCGIFAERHMVQNDAGGDVTNVALALPIPAVLTGKLRTPDLKPIENASVDAMALGLDLDLAANDPTVVRYNRSKQTTTDSHGSFELPVDLGSYDVAIKPPADSGFAWQMLHDVNIASRQDIFSTVITVEAPVLVVGTLSYAGESKSTQHSLAGAEVHAYTMIGSGDKARSIEIARSTADDNGDVMLLISPKFQSF